MFGSYVEDHDKQNIQKYYYKESWVHRNWTDREFTRVTAGVFYELKKGTKEVEYHPQDCARPNHYESEWLVKKREECGLYVELLNRNKEPFDSENE